MTAPRILIVEDSLSQAVRLQHVLRSAGYEVQHAASAEAALRALNERLPHLMVVDHHLPGLSGVDLCRQVRLNVATIGMPILMLTADETPQRQREGLDSGADDFLPKSADYDLLLRQVRALLRLVRPDDTGSLPGPVFRQPRILVAGELGSEAAAIEGFLREEGCQAEFAPDAIAPPTAGLDCLFLVARPDGTFDTAIAGDVDGRLAPEQRPGMILLLPPGAPVGADRPDLSVDYTFVLGQPLAPLRARLRAMLRRRFLEEQNHRMLADFRARESRALRLEAERNAAEARAAMADELHRANSRLAKANQLLAEQALITRTITDNVVSSIVMVNPDGRISFLNPAAEALLGRGMVGTGAAELCRRLGADAGLMDTTQPIREAVGRLDAPDGRTVPVTFSLVPLISEAGQTGAVVEILDVTERQRAEEKQLLLMGELSHRVKNTLATVLSIGAQTRRGHRTLEEFWPTFEGRVQALSATHNLLSAHHWEAVGLADLVRHEVRPYAGQDQRAVLIAGPDVALDSRQALTLALVIHELSTNAAKYGAFSAPSGRIEVTWETAEGAGGMPWLSLRWQEIGGPPVEEPRQPGFGSRLIRQSIAYELKGEARLTFDTAGVHCTMTIPLERRG